LEGTFLVNIVRILIPTLLAYYMGYIPAIIFHDYMGTLLTLLWIGGFWSYAFGNILVKRGGADAGESLPLDGPIQAMKEEGGKMVRDLGRGEA